MIRRLPSKATIGFLFLALGVVANGYRAEQIDNKQTETIRKIICLGQANTNTSRQRTPAEKAAIRAYYQKVLDIVGAKPCDTPLPQETP